MEYSDDYYCDYPMPRSEMRKLTLFSLLFYLYLTFIVYDVHYAYPGQPVVLAVAVSLMLLSHVSLELHFYGYL